MQKTIGIFSALLITLLFSFCDHQKKFEKQIHVLDSLKLELEKGIAVYKTIDTARLSRRINEYEQNFNFILEHVKDTLEKKDGEAVNAYKDLKKPLVYLYSKNKDFIIELETSKNQLRDLADDLKNNKIEEARAFEYFQNEKAYTLDLLKQLDKDMNLSKNEFPRFDSLNIKIKELIERYTNKK